METALKAKGELPPGLHLNSPSYYRDMIGSGELWVREDGLPLRQTLDLHFPEQDDRRVQAQITVDFSRFGETQFQAGQFVKVDPQSGLGSTTSIWQSLSQRAANFTIMKRYLDHPRRLGRRTHCSRRS